MKDTVLKRSVTNDEISTYKYAEKEPVSTLNVLGHVLYSSRFCMILLCSSIARIENHLFISFRSSTTGLNDLEAMIDLGAFEGITMKGSLALCTCFLLFLYFPHFLHGPFLYKYDINNVQLMFQISFEGLPYYMA